VFVLLKAWFEVGIAATVALSPASFNALGENLQEKD